MAQTGFTPIQLYSSSTTGNTPAAANLLNSSGGSELAINIFDGKLFYKDSSGNVQVIGWKVVPVSAGGTGQTSYTDGQLLIGNSTGNTLTKATLTAGTGITITNGSGAITINGTGGTVTSVAALTLGTTGTDLSSTVANGTTTPVITLNVPTASATNRGALSAADWTTFNNKQPAGTYVTNLTGPITSVGNATSIASQTGTGTTFAMSASPTFTGTLGAADLTTTGNTILGNASTDTLNVGNGGLVKDASGNVGIGVTPSAWNTNVKAAQLASGSVYSYSTVDLELTQNCYYNTSNQWIYSTTAPAERYSLYNGAHTWYNAPSGTAGNPITFTQAMTLDASGNLLVGKTTAGTGGGNGIQISQTSMSYVCSESSGGSGCYEFYSSNIGAYRFYVTSTGTVFATNTTITAISDQRLKENVRDLDCGLNKILALQPRRFDWKEGKGLDKKDDVGFIAQEFETVFPQSVVESKAGEDGIEYKALNHSELIPTLVKAIQEQQAIITSLTARLDALEG